MAFSTVRDDTRRRAETYVTISAQLLPPPTNRHTPCRMRLRMGPSILGPSSRSLPLLLPPIRVVLHHGVRLLPPNHHPESLGEPAAQPPRRRRALDAGGKLHPRGRRGGLCILRGSDHGQRLAVRGAAACGRRCAQQAWRTDGAALGARCRRHLCCLHRRYQQEDVRIP